MNDYLLRCVEAATLAVKRIERWLSGLKKEFQVNEPARNSYRTENTSAIQKVSMD
ncbi:MAG: hypothetical protein MN733_17640 [Nitrososphaera sp.]|nr:hypothetical protein [Nitrososphaera sp.]